ncbi:MAG: 4-hydroxy-tetrahydrodipicolinate synthase [Simkaniaceae bacterium]|nr:4-hydroxy-tetrahydrodipicolinate synthase [Simkaniaceae bacterium]MCF7851836.1 4-hydroxy-tetrahydrodipicolinate synthase [Simkaniaceae bacterium]
MLPTFSSFVPIITPFNSQGDVDYSALKRLIEWHIINETKGLVCFGTTGECSTLSEDEKIEILEFCCDIIQGETKLIANTGTNSTLVSKRLTAIAQELGVDAALIVVPYYNRPNEKGCIAHYREIAACGLPFIAYHIPSRTGIELSFEAICQILSIENCIGIKECSGHSQLIRQIANAFPNHYIFSGNDHSILNDLRAGANGSIGAIGNVIPTIWQAILNLSQLDLIRAEGLFNKYHALIRLIYSDVNPQGIKCALSCMGFIENRLRLPLIPVSGELEELIYQELLHLGLLEMETQTIYEK